MTTIIIIIIITIIIYSNASGVKNSYATSMINKHINYLNVVKTD